MLRLTLPFITGLLFVGSVSSQDNDEVRAAVKELQGEWQFVRIERNGQAVALEQLRKSKITIVKQTLVWADNGKDETWFFEVNPAKTPREFDLIANDGDIALGVPGIYRLDKDRLSICLGFNDGCKRPTTFKNQTGTENLLMVLERAKK